LACIPESAYTASRKSEAFMNGFLHGLTGVIIAAVAIVLVLGVVNMMRGTSPNRSQTLMRWRVILQFAAIVVMMTALYLAERH
jgi:hypothetical protein